LKTLWCVAEVTGIPANQTYSGVVMAANKVTAVHGREEETFRATTLGRPGQRAALFLCRFLCRCAEALPA
jgi:hypothetical protein